MQDLSIELTSIWPLFLSPLLCLMDTSAVLLCRMLRGNKRLQWSWSSVRPVALTPWFFAGRDLCPVQCRIDFLRLCCPCPNCLLSGWVGLGLTIPQERGTIFGFKAWDVIFSLHNNLYLDNRICNQRRFQTFGQGGPVKYVSKYLTSFSLLEGAKVKVYSQTEWGMAKFLDKMVEIDSIHINYECSMFGIYGDIDH